MLSLLAASDVSSASRLRSASFSSLSASMGSDTGTLLTRTRLRPDVEVRAPPVHHRGERLGIAPLHRFDELRHGALERLQGFGAMLVQALDLEIQLGALGGDAARNLDLRIE